MYKVLKSCSGGFFGAALPGSFLLYEDFLFSIEQFSSGAASTALDDDCPREEAQLTAQSLVFLSKARFMEVNLFPVLNVFLSYESGT